MRFLVDVSRARHLPFSFRKRTSFRNSEIRQGVSGFANYERIYFAGLDMTFEWGSFNKHKPSHSQRIADAKAKAKAA